MLFRELRIGDIFEFESVRRFPFSGMVRGPWVKVSARGYVALLAEHPLAQKKLRVGSLLVRVDRLGE